MSLFYHMERFPAPHKVRMSHSYDSVHKYWGRFHRDRLDCWVFGDKHTGGYLLKFNWFPIERHTLVKGRSSPDDPRLKDYWAKR